MATYYVDDGGDNSTGASWATAYTSFKALDDARGLASGDIVYVGHDHAETETYAGQETFTGPTTGAPCNIISVTQGSDPPTYQVATAVQLDTSAGAYSLVFDGSFALFGLKMKSGTFFNFTNDTNEVGYCEDCTFLPGHNSYLTGSNSSKTIFINCTLDLSSDTGTANSYAMFSNGASEGIVQNLTVTNASNRTATLISQAANSFASFSGCDFSSATGIASLVNATQTGHLNINNCKVAANIPIVLITVPGYVMAVNVASADATTQMEYSDYYGQVYSTTAIYRTGGASVESTPFSWLVVTYLSTYVSEYSPFATPWVYGSVASTGSKTFSMYVTTDDAGGAFNDDECWIQVEYLGTSDSAQSTLVTDRRATFLTSASAQTTDGTSTWNGTGPSFTNKQVVSVTATVNETGLYRARVVFARHSLSSVDYTYIDPKVVIS